jgi:hypothetical protein
MSSSKGSLMLLALLLATGCRAAPDGGAEAEPALLVEPSAQTRADLQQLISAALGADVTLSESALTDSHLLVIERKRHVDADGTRILGRDLGAPERFMLILAGGECLLEYARTGDRWPLPDAACVAVTAQPTSSR